MSKIVVIKQLQKTLLLLIFCCFHALAQDTLINHQIQHYSQKVISYLDKDSALGNYYLIDSAGISIFNSEQSKKENTKEFYVNWNQLDSLKRYLNAASRSDAFPMYIKGAYNDSIANLVHVNAPINKNTNESNAIKKLNGLRIAIDPGHMAADMKTGDIEKKSLIFKNTDTTLSVDSIRIAEGMLTFATAKLLKDRLEGEGAEVFMTRNFNGCTAFGITYDEWLEKQYATTVDSLFRIGKISQEQKTFFTGRKASKRDKFRVIFKDVELAKRAEIINNYKPDFTIIIHYNVDEANTDWKKPSTKNFNMTFIGGAFMKGDLPTPEKRFEFLRMLITDDLEQSEALSAAAVRHFEILLNVKTAETKDAAYLKEGCLKTFQPGVFCRNLQLTRYIHGPIVYGETLYQDNEKECVLLSKETDKTKNERVQQVAEAYFQGVLEYVQKAKK